MPKVSVVMSVYNGERYLSESIESVLGQTYRDFEFIVIDDGSVDSTPEILARYAEYDQRIKVITQDNHGLAASLNKGIYIARGQWIARMDADDVCLRDRLESQLAWLKNTGADMCGGWARVFGTATWRTRRYHAEDDAIKLQLCFRTAFSHPAVIMRKKLVQQITYDENIKRGQDYNLWTRFALAGARMTNVQKKVLRYRMHPGQKGAAKRKDTLIQRNASQQDYVEQVIDWPDASRIMRKFSSPEDAPSIEDARLLMEVIMSIAWASSEAKLHCFSGALRYVRPQTYGVFLLHEEMRNRLSLPPNPAAISLWFQSAFRCSSDSRAYKFLKRFT